MNTRDYSLILKTNLTTYVDQVAWAAISFFLVTISLHFINKMGLGFITNEDLPIDRKYLPLIIWLILFIFSKDWVLQQWNNLWINSKNYSLSLDRWSRDWIWQGAPRIERDGLIVTNCSAGCLLQNRAWKNLRVNLIIAWSTIYEGRDNSVFPNKLGLIFRADNLENYFMLQIELSNNIIRVNPHVRLNGSWESISDQGNQMEYFGLERNTIQNGFPVELLVSNDKAIVRVNNIQAIQWYLPTHANLKQEEEDFLPNRIIPRINFRDKAGMFGFRNFRNESCLIKKLSVTGLDTDQAISLVPNFF